MKTKTNVKAGSGGDRPSETLSLLCKFAQGVEVGSEALRRSTRRNRWKPNRM